jgi:hypothetical protein
MKTNYFYLKSNEKKNMSSQGCWNGRRVAGESPVSLKGFPLARSHPAESCVGDL